MYKPENEDLLEDSTNIYEAGTDFKMIVTSVGAFRFGNINKEDYKKDWNRPSIGCQHFCASYIRNDMINTAPINNICYGFSKMEDDALLMSSIEDLGSNTEDSFVSYAGSSVFFTPEEQINNTFFYNEMDYKRMQNGVKKQPSYIVVFRENGQITNMEESLKAQQDWEGLPIVIVDKDKCLESEKEKVKQMIEEYNKEPSESFGKQIRQKVSNNRKTRETFCKEIEELIPKENNDEKEVVGRKELETNYNMVNANERKQEISKITQLYIKIYEIAKEDEHESR